MAKCKGYLPDSLYKEFVSHDPEYGVLYWKTRDPNHFRTEGAYKSFNKRCVGKEAGHFNKSDGYKYLRITYKGELYIAPVHRLMWFLEKGEWPSGVIDHINGDRTDNRICNLRDVEQKINSRNCKLSSSNKSGFAGVWYDAALNKWQAYVKVDYKKRCLGYFETIEQAVEARAKVNLQHGFHENHGMR